MGTLREDALSLREFADRVREQASSVDEAARLQQRLEESAKEVTQLQRAKQTAAALVAAGFPVAVPEVTTARQAVATLAGALDSASVVPADAVFTAARRCSGQVSAQLSEAAATAWHLTGQARLRAVPSVRVALLPPREHAEISAMWKHLEEIAAAPPSPEQVQRFDRDLHKVSDRLATVGVDVPDSVLALLHAAEQPGGAALDALTPEVLTWLLSHGYTTQLRVVKRRF